MDEEQLRRQICFEAARLLNARRETNFTKARWRAVRSITRRHVDSTVLPTDMEIRGALQELFPSTSSVAAPTEVPPENPMDLPLDRFARYHALLEPLDRVWPSRELHPEGDLLYHSLQVYELADQARPWDEDFLLAALLHDVGKGIDPYDGHAATLDAICEIVSERTLWFVEHLPLQHRVHEGTIGIRARRRITQHEDADELRTLSHCDSDGRVPGRQVRSLQQAIDDIQSLSDYESQESTP